MFKNLLPELKKQSLEAKRPLSFADLMEDFWRRPFAALPFFGKELEYPAVDVSETDKEITVKAELPGIEAKDVDITLDAGLLTIRGEKKFEAEEKKENYHRIERSYGSFSRSIALPAEVDESKVKARFDKGVLSVTVQKSKAAKPAKKIPIQS
jgi:HSP20 family protein